MSLAVHPSIPLRVGTAEPPLLSVRGLTVELPTRAGWVRPVNEASFQLAVGEALRLVGESGCGKTTLARLLLRLIEPDSGEVHFCGRDLLAARGIGLRTLRREMQMVFQDPFASLNPRQRVEAIVGEPLEIHAPHLSRGARRVRVVETLKAVGLGSEAMPKHPHEFSGGQRQRIGIARALVLRPRLLVADEPVSALDVSVGAQILALLQSLQSEYSLTHLFISHSLPVVAQLASRVAVMHAGKFVEVDPPTWFSASPRIPTRKHSWPPCQSFRPCSGRFRAVPILLARCSCRSARGQRSGSLKSSGRKNLSAAGLYSIAGRSALNSRQRKLSAARSVGVWGPQTATKIFLWWRSLIMATIPPPGPAPDLEAQAPVNHFGRIFGALFSPKATFEEIVRRPSWVAPVVLLTIISLGVSVLMAKKVNWERVVAQSIERSPQAAQLSAEQRQQRIEVGAKFARVFVYVFGTLGSILAVLIFAAICLGAFNLLAGAGVRFGTAMGIVAHAFLPSAISGVLGIVILSIKDPETIDPETLVAANLGVLVPGDAPKWLAKLAGSFDLFVFWIMVLLAVGFSAASPKKVTLGKSLGIIFGLWAIYVLAKVGWAAL